jgi:hypothetical protein
MRTVLVVMVIAAAIGGGLAGAGALSGGGPAVRAEVTGYIDPCEGMGIGMRYAARTLPYAAGTVTALRGSQTWKLVRGESNATYQTYRLVLPAAVAARQHVSQNRRFSFELPPGDYVLVGRYDDGSGTTYLDVTIAAGRVLHRDLPNLCK